MVTINFVLEGQLHHRAGVMACIRGVCGARHPREPGIWSTCVASALALLWMTALPVAAQATAPAASSRAACTLVFGHGRNAAADNDAANKSWDKVNQAFASVVATELGAQGLRSVRISLPVTVSDLAVIVPALLEHAEREGCTRIVEATLFVNEDDDVLVARLRAYPVQRSGTSTRIGQSDYSHQQEYPNTQRNRDRLVPAALGLNFATAYLSRPGR